MAAPYRFEGGNSPDNRVHSATDDPCVFPGRHNAQAFGTPKMPGEPPRVQPSKKVAAHWDDDGNPKK
ncbi:hypothetical protein [Mycolicibacterium vinylchloridicum]|uniref:hypothetical protein n=1 Tax=Mycolicibacterium vinylchloridicum TaxID=2736928 RepID=UPI0015C703BF|nr:hypothetical protein [Mycolicibacterium vinylchloridicum]